MASYLPNSQDYIPQVQPFNPNLNFYANVLSTKQAQYDAGLKQLGSIYGSALNSPMIRDDNNQRRDEYFKTIEQDMKKITRMDLSIDQNVATAERLFDPILNDKYMVKDMVYTRGLQSAYTTGEGFRNCVDPDKCGGEFSEISMQALGYAAEEFQRAGAEESLKFQAPKFVPAQNVTKKAIKAAKEAGFNISYDYVKNGYIVTDTNGQLLLGENGDGILPQYLYGMFGNDGKVQEWYSTQAYVGRKNFSKQYAAQFGSEEAAERAYLDRLIPEAAVKLENSKAQLQEQRDRIDIDLKAYDLLVEKEGIADKGVQSTYEKLLALQEATNKAQEYHDNVSNVLETTSNVNDIQQLRRRADNIVGNELFMREINSAAQQYAMGTAKRELKADPYSLAAYNDSLNLNRALKLKDADQYYWEKRQLALGNVMRDEFGNLKPGPGKAGSKQEKEARLQMTTERLLQAMAEKGMKVSDFYGDGVHEGNLNTDWAHKKLISKGLLTGTDAKPVEGTFIIPEKIPVVDTYDSNAQVTTQATDKASAASNSFFIDTINSMQREFKKASNNPDGQARKVIREKILSDAGLMFKDSGIDPIMQHAIINGNMTPEEALKTVNDVSGVINTAAQFQLEEGFSSARVYNSGWDPEKIVAMQQANQVAQGLIKKRTAYQKEALGSVWSDVINRLKNYDTEVGYKDEVAIHSMFDKDGFKKDYETAKREFINGYGPRIFQETTYGGDPVSLRGKSVDEILSVAAEELFRPLYDKYDTEYTNNLKSLTSKDGDRGGAEMAAARTVLTVDGNMPYETDYKDLRDIFTRFKNNEQGYSVAGAGVTSENQLKDDEFVRGSFNRVMDLMLKGETKGMKMNVEVQPVPGDVQKIALRVNVDEDFARKAHNKTKKDEITPSEKSFTVEVTDLGPTFEKFLTKFDSPEDILLRNEGESVSSIIPGKGSFTVRREKGYLMLDRTIPFFDENVGDFVQMDLPPMPFVNEDNKPDERSLADISKAALESMTELAQTMEVKKRRYVELLKAAKNGQATVQN